MTHAFKKRLIANFESIAHQYDREFFTAVIQAVQGIKDNLNDRKALVQSIDAINDLVFRNTGLLINLELHNTMYYQAYMLAPDIKNNPIIPNDMNAKHNDTITTAIVNSKYDPKGTIDLKRGKVTGVYSKVLVRIVMAVPYFSTDFFTTEEVAAIFLHELGHVFTMFLTTTVMIKTNYAIRSIRQNLEGMTDKQIRYQVLSKYEQQNGITISDKETLVENPSELNATIFLAKAFQHKYRNEYGVDVYDRRSAEYLADQYVARLGAAKASATSLVKYGMAAAAPSYDSFGVYLATELSKVLLSSMTLFIVPIFLLTRGDPLEGAVSERYDPPAARLKRIRHQAIDSLKAKNLPEEIRKNIVAEIEFIKNIESMVNDRPTFFEAIYGFIIPSARRVRENINKQKLLEELGNNELYVAAATLKDFKA